jgi:hypothetical protein
MRDFEILKDILLFLIRIDSGAQKVVSLGSP